MCVEHVWHCQAGMWGTGAPGERTVAGAFLDSSSGGFTFNREDDPVRPSRIVTVTIAGSGCDNVAAGNQADAAATALGIDINQYTFK